MVCGQGLSWNRTNGGITAPCAGCPDLLGLPTACPSLGSCASPLLQTAVALPTDWDDPKRYQSSAAPSCVGETCAGDMMMVDSYNHKCLSNVSVCPSKTCGNFCDVGQNRWGCKSAQNISEFCADDLRNSSCGQGS